jgi:hypothetical protein
LEPILNQMSSAHTLTIYVLIVHVSIILTSKPSSPNFLSSFQVFQIIMLPAQFFPLFHVVTCPTQSQFDHPNFIWWGK